VPFLRMPGEVLARAAGQRSFPDRVTLIAVLAIVIAILVRATDGQPSLQRASLIAVVGLLPAFVTLLRTRMFVYEEAVDGSTPPRWSPASARGYGRRCSCTDSRPWRSSQR
jgi:hypothetical protein